MLRSPVGHALLWRGVAIGTAGVALLVALCAPRVRRLALAAAGIAALAAAGIAALAAVIVHVANGHAGASRWPSVITVILQAVHVAVAGVWIGGLAALMVGIRGTPSAEKAASVRRFVEEADTAGVAGFLTGGAIRLELIRALRRGGAGGGISPAGDDPDPRELRAKSRTGYGIVPMIVTPEFLVSEATEVEARKSF